MGQFIKKLFEFSAIILSSPWRYHILAHEACLICFRNEFVVICGLRYLVYRDNEKKKKRYLLFIYGIIIIFIIVIIIIIIIMATSILITNIIIYIIY